MDPKRLLTVMATRLYEDIKFVTEQNPTQIVDDDGAKAYNALLTKARKQYGHVEHMGDFPDWSARTIKYKDALVVAGQFAAMLEALSGQETRISGKVVAAGGGPITSGTGATPLPTQGTPMVAGRPRPVPSTPTRPSGGPHDEELYGPVANSKRNDDGTIPFSLD